MSIDKDRTNDTVFKDIVAAIRSIRFGYVQIVIQDSKVVQIEKTEKVRLDNKPKEGGELLKKI